MNNFNNYTTRLRIERNAFDKFVGHELVHDDQTWYFSPVTKNNK